MQQMLLVLAALVMVVVLSSRREHKGEGSKLTQLFNNKSNGYLVLYSCDSVESTELTTSYSHI